MKLVSLNCWGGRLFEPLMRFVEESRDADILCFQEVFHNEDGKTTLTDNYHPDLFHELQRRLPNHQGFFELYEVGHSYDEPVDYQLKFGLAAFVPQAMTVTNHGAVWISSKEADTPGAFRDRNLQYLQLAVAGTTLTVANLHGIWIKGAGKVDTPLRLAQSAEILKMLDSLAGEQILCGDFNLDPDTKSLAMLEAGKRNLIKDYGIKSTRTKYYEKPGKFADYVLTTTGISIHDFTVPDRPVSDHRPLLLEFELAT